MEVGTLRIQCSVGCSVLGSVAPAFFFAQGAHCCQSVGQNWNRTLLKSFPKLRKLETINDEEYITGGFPDIDVADFIDWDAELTDMRDWLFKTSLETLAIKITGVPQLDWTGPSGQQADHLPFPETHQQICQRLGQFANLKILRLGHEASVKASRYVWINRWKRGYKPTIVTVPKQYMCVHLTLETGLDWLSELKKLEELHILSLDHHVTKEAEVVCMVGNWPKLSKISGLGANTDAYEWLQENHPGSRHCSTIRLLPLHEDLSDQKSTLLSYSFHRSIPL